VKSNEKTILVVDDEEGIRETVREVLADEGYRVIGAPGASMAMDLIGKERPHLVLNHQPFVVFPGIVLSYFQGPLRCC